MNKQEFMNKLELLLSDIPEDERKEALNYYEDYFLDAGEENEMDIIRELESPEKVALNIKEGLGDAYKSKGEFTEDGFSGYTDYAKDEIANNIPNSTDRGFTQKKERKPVSGLTILLFILASPFIFLIVIVLFSLLIAAASTLFGLLVAAVATAVSMLVVGVVLLVVGLAAFVASPISTLIMVGIGLIALGIGILGSMFIVWIVSKALPAILRGFVSLIRGLFHLNRKEVA